MTPTVPVFVNARKVEIPAGGTALDAVRALDPDAAREIDAGTRIVTDSRGLPVDPAIPVEAGSILRVLPARARDAEPDGDLLH